MKLIALQMKTTANFDDNLNHLITLINNCEDNSIILAPELVLTGFSYQKMEEASVFTKKALKLIKDNSKDKTIGLTLINKKNNKYFNTFYLFYDKKLIHTQSKTKLFALGEEEKYFTKGKKKDIKIIELNGLKIAILICFEIRFIKLWKKIIGADIILNPAMWGLKRKEHYETIPKALAILNQCYVIASNSANKDMAKNSTVISPFGNSIIDNNKEILQQDIDINEIKRFRKYIDIGLNNYE